MPVDLNITIDDAGLVARMEQFPALAGRAIIKTLDRENETTVSAITERRLRFSKDGPPTLEGLRWQTGNLARSLHRNLARIEGTQIKSSIGSPVKYAGVHEFGFSGTVQVPGHSRRQVIKRSFKFGGSSRTRNTQGRDVFVRPHSRRVTFPARRPIGRTIEERLPAYKEAITNALALVLRPGPSGI